MFKLFMHYTGEGEEDHIIMAPLEDDDAITVKDLQVNLFAGGKREQRTKTVFCIPGQRLVGVLGKSMDSEELEDMIKECSVSGAKGTRNCGPSLGQAKTLTP